jgi:hypothetical protein
MIEIHCKYDELLPIHEVKFHPKNRNSHPKDQIERLAEILKYQGWRYPIKISNLSGCIVSGHGRVLAARHLGLETVPVQRQDYETEEQEYADLISDNSIASWSELDLSSINSDIVDLGPDFNIDMLGIEHFKIDIGEKLDDAIEQLNEEREKKWIFEAQFPNEMEMMDAHDHLHAQGYLVKIK